MLKFANHSTREQLAALAVMMLGFAPSAGVVLGAYAGLLAIHGTVVGVNAGPLVTFS